MRNNKYGAIAVIFAIVLIAVSVACCKRPGPTNPDPETANPNVQVPLYGIKRVLITEVVDKSEDGLSQGAKDMIRETLSQAINRSDNCQSHTEISIKTVDATFDKYGNVTTTVLSYAQRYQMEYILVTEATPLNKSAISLSARIIKTDSGRIVATSSVSAAASFQCLQSACHTLANDLVSSFMVSKR